MTKYMNTNSIRPLKRLLAVSVIISAAITSYPVFATALCQPGCQCKWTYTHSCSASSEPTKNKKD